MTQFLVKVRGEPKGPYSESQLQTQIRRKRLSRQHQVSSDGGISWQRAGEVDELFAASNASVSELVVEDVAEEPAAPTQVQTPMSDSSDRQWMYAVMGQQLGPVPESEIRILIASGGIPDDTLLWHDGMTDWMEVQHIPAFSAAVRSKQSNADFKLDAAATNGSASSGKKKSLHWPSIVAMLTAIAGWTTLLPGAVFALAASGALSYPIANRSGDNVLVILLLVVLALSPSLLCCVTSINLGHKAMKYADRQPGQHDGTTYSIFGLVLGYLTALSLLGLTISCIVAASR